MLRIKNKNISYLSKCGRHLIKTKIKAKYWYNIRKIKLIKDTHVYRYNKRNWMGKFLIFLVSNTVYMTFTKFQMSNSYCKSFNIGYSECCIYTFHLKKFKINARKISHSVLPFWYPHGLRLWYFQTKSFLYKLYCMTIL